MPPPSPTRLERLEKLLAADPADPFILYGIAQEHAASGDHEAALGFYDRCLTADPAYAYGYYHKARSLLELERAEEAKATIERGIGAARAAGDGKALGELEALLESV